MESIADFRIFVNHIGIISQFDEKNKGRFDVFYSRDLKPLAKEERSGYTVKNVSRRMHDE